MAPLRSSSPNNRAGVCDTARTKSLIAQPAAPGFGQDGGQQRFQARESRQRLAQILPSRIFFILVMGSMIAADGGNVAALERAPERIHVAPRFAAAA